MAGLISLISCTRSGCGSRYYLYNKLGSRTFTKGEWLSAGVHINAAGVSVPFLRELDSDAVVKSSLFVDRKESTLTEAGDFLIPKKEGLLMMFISKVN